MTVIITFANPDNGSVYTTTTETILGRVDFLAMLIETVGADEVERIIDIEFR